jgi:tetratricopeptide (TPR) repeat protein
MARGDALTRRWLLSGALLLAAVAAALLTSRWLHARSERQEALRLAGLGRFTQARPLLDSALARDPRDVEVLTQLALGTLTDEPDAAEGYLTRWSALRPGEPQPYRLRMALRHERGRRERSAAEQLRLLGEALDDGQRVLELEPDDDRIRREVVWLMLRVGRFADAEATCRICLARAPGDPWLLYLQARALHGRGDRAAAEAVLDPVVASQPGFAEALLLRATLHREAGRPGLAVPLLRQALALKSALRKECLYQLGLALGAAGQDGEARRVLAELELLNLQEWIARDQLPTTPAVRVQLAELMLAAGKTTEARAVLDAVLKEVPDFAPALQALKKTAGGKVRDDKMTR